MLEELVAIEEVVDDTGDETAGLLTARVAWIGVVVIALGVLGLIGFMMPPKIKKIE